MERDRVVDTIAHEGDVLARTSGDLDDSRLLIGTNPREDSRLENRRRKLIIAHRPDIRTVEEPFAGEADLGADLGRDLSVVTRDDLHFDSKPLQLGEGLSSISLGPVREGEETL